MLAALLLLALQDTSPPAPAVCPFDRVIPLDITASDPVLDGHGHSKRVEYTSEFSGTLHVWTKVEGDFDLFLRLEDPEGKLIAEDDNSGGGKTPYLRLEVEPGRVLHAIVGNARGEGIGTFGLHLVSAPETESTRLAAEDAKVAIAEIKRLREAKDIRAARSLAMMAIERLAAVDGTSVSELACGRIWDLGFEAYGLSLLKPAAQAYRQSLAHRSRTLPGEHPGQQTARTNLAMSIKGLGDLRGARTLEEQALEVFRRTLPDDHPDLQRTRQNLAGTIQALGDLAGARALFEKVLEVRARTLPNDHPDLQLARLNLAVTIERLGDVAGARVLEERALEILSRTLPDDHPDLQGARQNLAGTLLALGDIAGAGALFEKVLEVYSRTLPSGHPQLQAARLNLATTLGKLGDLAGARQLQEQVLEGFSLTLPDDHPDLQAARQNLAGTLHKLGDLAGARALKEKVFEVRSRTLPDDHPDLQAARMNLALTIQALGERTRARVLEEKVLEVFSRTLPHDHPNLQKARLALASTIESLGELAAARALEDEVLEVSSRTLPDDHPDLQKSRLSLAGTLHELGDSAGARALQEKVLEVDSRTLPDGHPDLQAARNNLAVTIRALGDLEGARALFEKVLDAYSRTLPDDHPDLQKARQNLAATRKLLGDTAGVRALEEKVLEVRSLTLPEDHPDLQDARLNLATTLSVFGDLAEGRAIFEAVLESASRALSEDHPGLRRARQNLAITIARQLARAGRASSVEGEKRSGNELDRERCVELVGSLCRSQEGAARVAILHGSAREAEERCSSLVQDLDLSLSFACGYGVFEPLRPLEPDSFALSETSRAAALVSARLTRRAAREPKYGELRVALKEASEELTSLVQRGATSEAFARARSRRESIERELVALAGQGAGGAPCGLEIDVESLAAQLDEREAAVGFRRFRKSGVHIADELDSTGRPAVAATSVDSLCAFVVHRPRPDGAGHPVPPPILELVDLGPIRPIEEAVHEWRESLGVGEGARGTSAAIQGSSGRRIEEHGVKLRQRLFDPLLSLLAGADRVVLAVDDVLHLIPFDALPVDAQGDVLLGDRWRIETRATLSELLDTMSRLEGAGTWIGLGGVNYGGATGTSQASTPSIATRGPGVAGILDGTPWAASFSALPGTRDEVEGISECFRSVFGDRSEQGMLERNDATRERLFELAPRARWLHMATHGWFARDSIKSWSDPGPLDKLSGLGLRLSGKDQVKGMSPMLLCGLALAGANLPEDAVGRVPGLVTADELSTLDLTSCELVVLSACDTHVGERRAGQGVHSLQMALQMAGARSVITSLWKVPDEATKELMLDFYRRLWVEKKPKWQALWEAKKKLREAKDESGKAKYSTRDWAAWVLTGDPN